MSHFVLLLKNNYVFYALYLQLENFPECTILLAIAEDRLYTNSANVDCFLKCITSNSQQKLLLTHAHYD